MEDSEFKKIEELLKQPQQLAFSESKNTGMSKILVTGGAGYIGSHTVQALQKNGYEVVVLDNLSSGHMENVSCPLIVGDLNDTNLLDKIFQTHNIEAVVHFAGSIIVSESVTNPEKYFQNNTICSINLANAMVRHGVKKIIFSSTAAVYGNPHYMPIDEDHPKLPTNPYGETKLSFEKVLKWYFASHGISSVSLRYFNAAGASLDCSIGEAHPLETHLIPKILNVAARIEPAVKIFGTDYETFDGTAIRDYIHVVDLAQAHILALNKIEKEPGHFSYNVGTGNGFSNKQVVDAVVEVTQRMIPIECTDRRAGDPPSLVADATLIRNELGFEPQHSDLKTIIQTAWNWHKKMFNLEDKKQKNQEISQTA